MLLVMRHFPAGAEGQAYWVHLDGRGSIAGITQHQGQSTHNYRYDAYGQLLPAQGNWTDPHNHYTFAGKEWDEHLGLYGCRGRKPGFPGSGDSGWLRSLNDRRGAEATFSLVARSVQAGQRPVFCKEGLQSQTSILDGAMVAAKAAPTKRWFL